MVYKLRVIRYNLFDFYNFSYKCFILSFDFNKINSICTIGQRQPMFRVTLGIHPRH